MSDQIYTCGVCTRTTSHDGREAFLQHLVTKHPESWLAKKARAELESRETSKNANGK